MKFLGVFFHVLADANIVGLKSLVTMMMDKGIPGKYNLVTCFVNSKC